MSKIIEKQTMTCYYCHGTGKMNYPLEYIGEVLIESVRCQDCLGAGVLCILCTQPPSLCECPLYNFDPTDSRRFKDNEAS